MSRLPATRQSNGMRSKPRTMRFTSFCAASFCAPPAAFVAAPGRATTTPSACSSFIDAPSDVLPRPRSLRLCYDVWRRRKVTVGDPDRLAEEFETHRIHLRAVAYRMLGSFAEADDAVQETWLRLIRSDTSDVENLRGWLTTVVGRVCLDMLRTRTARREDVLDVHLPDPIVSAVDDSGPEQQAVLADSVGLALLVVLDTLSPAERLAFVLHDVFDVPFDQIGVVLERSPAAAKQLASRARRRLRGTAASPRADLARQRGIVDAFLSAARDGDFEGLLAV